MMNIQKINQMNDPHPPDLNRRTSAKGFRQILEGKLSGSGAVRHPTEDSKTELLDRGNQLLGLLDDYVRQLKNPALTLKEIAPLTDRIQTEMEKIASKTAGIIPQNPEMEQFFTDLAVTAQVAVFKFKRGDYV